MFWPLFDEFGHLRNRNGVMECTDVKAELCTMSKDGLEVFTLMAKIVEINVAAHHTDGGLQLELSQQASLARSAMSFAFPILRATSEAKHQASCFSFRSCACSMYVFHALAEYVRLSPSRTRNSSISLTLSSPSLSARRTFLVIYASPPVCSQSQARSTSWSLH
jgi:hypothetical protein